MEQQKKVVKIVKHYEDGSTDTISGVALDNYNTNMNIANGICLSRSYITFKPVEWVLESGGVLTSDNRPIENFPKGLADELIK